MRRVFLTLFLCLPFVLLFAQRSDNNLKPSELIQEAKTQGAAFQEIDLFTLLLAQPGEAEEEELKSRFSHYDLLQINPEGFRHVLKNTPSEISFSLPGTSRSNIELELVKVEILSDDFSVVESASNAPVEVEPGIHYRGVVKGERESLVAISFFEGEIMGLVSSSNFGTLVLGKLSNNNNNSLQHVLYDDRDVFQQEDFECGTPDDGLGYTLEDLQPHADTYRSAANCVKIYFEVDYDIFQNKGGTTGATNYVTGIFNQVATLYSNDQVGISISQIFVWTNPSPYTGTSSSQLLSQFQQYRTTINGDLGQLLSYKGSGGIAVLNGLCHPYTAGKLSFSSINTSYSNVPTYSFTVMVVAHELGHLMGSHHTHACVWNGNNTAIDGCAGFVEGNCSLPSIPSGGGTIMSYCHITSTGINFNLGFGAQPGTVIRNKVAAASCLTACSGGGGGGGGNPNPSTCTKNTVYLRLVLDNYGPETSWKLKDASGNVIESGGPYSKGVAGTIVRDTFCLADGCYKFEITDTYGDGICCNFGNGSYTLTNKDGQTIASGGNFTFNEVKDICVPGSGGGGGGGTCVSIDFKNYQIVAYGAGQDIGTYQLLNNGTELKIQNNAWKAILLNYNVTPNTVLELEFGSTIKGEVHGIGFDNDDNISSNRTFKFYGTQSWGILNYNNYPGDNSWRRYVIPVGQFYTGAFNRLFFVADNDIGTGEGNSYFRKIKIYEGSSCQGIVGEADTARYLSQSAPTADQTGLSIFPNPANENVTLSFLTKENMDAHFQIFNAQGQIVQQWKNAVVEGLNNEQMNINQLPVGVYFVKIDLGFGQLMSKFNVSR